MTELRTDEEKGEAIIAWWKENWISLVSGVGLAIAILFGYQYWQSYQENQQTEASSIYSNLLSQSNSANAEGVFTLADRLRDDYAGTAYAPLGMMVAAKNYAQQSKNDQAADSLQWVIDNADEKMVNDLAKMQLSRLYVSMKQYDKAEGLLAEKYPAAWQSGIDELKGDIAVGKQDFQAAKSAYESALRSSKGGSTEYLQMKLDNLAGGSTDAGV